MSAPKTISLRIATAADISSILNLLAEMDAGDGGTRTAVITADHLHRVVFGPRPQAEAVLAECDARVIGLAAFRMNASTFGTRPEVYLDDLYVTAEYRRRGVGRALLGELARIALARSAGRILLNVQIGNREATDFYQRCGGEIFAESRACQFAAEHLQRLANSPWDS